MPLLGAPGLTRGPDPRLGCVWLLLCPPQPRNHGKHRRPQAQSQRHQALLGCSPRFLSCPSGHEGLALRHTAFAHRLAGT